jgi:transposase-like protein
MRACRAGLGAATQGRIRHRPKRAYPRREAGCSGASLVISADHKEVLMDNAPDSTSTVARRSRSARGVFPPPRKLSDEQERELARLYPETGTSTSEVARTFGISETSVARLAQRHGATLRRRGRVPGSGAPSTATTVPAASSGTTRASSSTTATRATRSARGRRTVPPPAPRVRRPHRDGGSALPSAASGWLRQRICARRSLMSRPRAQP